MYRNYEDEGFTEKDIEEMMTPNMPEDEKEDLVESNLEKRMRGE